MSRRYSNKNDSIEYSYSLESSSSSDKKPLREESLAKPQRKRCGKNTIQLEPFYECIPSHWVQPEKVRVPPQRVDVAPPCFKVQGKPFWIKVKVTPPPVDANPCPLTVYSEATEITPCKHLVPARKHLVKPPPLDVELEYEQTCRPCPCE